MEEDKLCLYRCWTNKIDGENIKMQSCYPHNGGGVGLAGNPRLGETVKEPIKSPDGKFHKFQAVRCKWPACS